MLKAGGSNYDAGAKKQGHESKEQSLKELKNIHVQEQVRASKTRTFVEKGIEVIDKEKTNQFWQKDREQQKQMQAKKAPPKKPAPELDPEERKKVWQLTSIFFFFIFVFLFLFYSSGVNTNQRSKLHQLHQMLLVI